ncbi:pre-mRNA-processing factor 39-like [Spea bombifrons]|uniref:pre-mRNA-processing factor 39-like n=1 Tax=Spea bombifrons TaxID=233779 RepID=UPI00234BC9EF|nr:pre-mRNA-processing factor 39-like [Spea bombifrons]
MAMQWGVSSGVSAGSDIPLTSEDCPGSDEDSNDAVEPDFSEEFTKNWEVAMENPSDFNSWIKLLDYVEKENNLKSSRRTYDAFLVRFPYCYCYWKKYADLEYNFKNPTVVEEVYGRALQAIPLSVDLWIHYITHLNNTLDMTLTESVEKLRRTFQEAVNAAGLEFRSDKLWRMYAEWERDHKNLQEARAVYDRVLSIPTQFYRQHLESFKDLLSSAPPHEILAKEELQWIHRKITSEENAQIAAEDSPSGDDQEIAVTDPELQEKIRDQVLKIREQFFLQNEAEVRKRWDFEEAITRPYFHASPLDRAQLQNWRRYLEFENSEGQHERVVTLYERCLVACALYEEFWLLYTRYMEKHSVEATRAIFQRACKIHLPQKPTLNLQWATFEEKHGKVDSARAILQDLETAVPGLVMVRLRRVSVERRSGNLDEAERLLMESVSSSSGTGMAAFYSIKLSRLLLKLRDETERAREVLTKALEKEPDNPRLHLCLLEMEVSRDPLQGEGNVMQCVERALHSHVHNDVKKVMSQRRLEFLEDQGSSLSSLLQAYDEHQRLLDQLRFLKRKAKNRKGEDTEDKKYKTESVAVVSQPQVCSPLPPPPLYTQPMPARPQYRGQVGPPFRPSSPYMYGPWYQNFRGYSNPMPWNTNRYFYP